MVMVVQRWKRRKSINGDIVNSGVGIETSVLEQENGEGGDRVGGGGAGK